jgi:5-methylcytosine-specific restriction protein A
VASAPLQCCAEPGCVTLVPRGRCTAHQRTVRQQHARFYTGGGFYGRRWRRESKAFLALHPWCVCGCGRLSEEVDHREPHRGDQALFWDQSNWQAMAKACHSAKTAREVLHAAP